MSLDEMLDQGIPPDSAANIIENWGFPRPEITDEIRLKYWTNEVQRLLTIDIVKMDQKELKDAENKVEYYSMRITTRQRPSTP